MTTSATKATARLTLLWLINMLGDINKQRYKAIELVAEEVRIPSKDLRLNAIARDIPDEDLRWVLDKLHYFLLKILEDAEYDPAEEECDFEALGLTD